MAASKSRQTVGINGYALRAIRTAKQIGARELAEAIGKNRSRIAQIEAMGDAHNRVTPDVLDALTEALNLHDARALLADPYSEVAA